MTRETPDGELLRIVRGTDPVRRREAATELLMRYRDAVYAWCFRYTRNHDRALDLSQDVMVTAWQRMDAFEGRSQFSSWLFSVARNRCIDATRRADIVAEDAVFDDPPDPAAAPDDAVVAEESRSLLMDMVKEVLDSVEQDAVYLRYFERRSVEDIGASLRIGGASGARAVLQRARRKLRAAGRARFPEGDELF
jgi:RNA polymerase sigma-70 factor (ECF subfamily)